MIPSPIAPILTKIRELRTTNTDTAKLGTFAGVFTPSFLTIIGLVLFLRMGYVVGAEGLPRALLIILVANIISVLTTLSIAAIATNHKVKSGGVYYLISRSLGVGYGGAIGIVLFLAQSVSVGFYCIGFAEAAAPLFSLSSLPATQAFALGAVLLLFGLAWIGADWATRAQYIIMAILALALLSFFMGAFQNAQWGHFAENLSAPNSAVPFWLAFAIFFPAVTGFTQGASMSGDLVNANKSIPTGTFAAVGLSIIVYFVCALLFAAATSQHTLIHNFRSMRDIAFYGPLIDAGVIGATLSSALASLMGAPRILQALAADDIFPVLRPFAEGAAVEGSPSNPRRALMLTGLISLVIIALGNLNAVAAIVSMFFVISYGLLNYATFFEARAASPSFRPTFRYYHPLVSLAGGFACLAVMLAINVVIGIVCVVILFALRSYLERKAAPASWADGRRAHHLREVRENIMQAAKLPEHARDWRPQLLIFSDSAVRRGRILKFSDWIIGNTGLATAVQVIEGKGAKALEERQQVEETLTQELGELKSSAFPLAIVAPKLNDALGVVIQSVGIGPVSVNTVVVNWSPEQPGFFERLFRQGYPENLEAAFHLGRNLVLLDADDNEWDSLQAVSPKDRIIDVWWHDGATGSFMLMLSHLMLRHHDWKKCFVRILVLPEDDKPFAESLTALRTMLDTVRIEAEAVPVASFSDLVAASRNSQLVFIPFVIQHGQFRHQHGGDLKPFLKELPITALCAAAEDVELDADPDDVSPKADQTPD